MCESSYFAIIPANVRYDKRLTPNAKLLFAEITCLCNKYGFCWATNDYFEKLYEVSQPTISSWVKQLVDCGYIVVKMDKVKNERHIWLNIGGIKENLYTPLKENFYHNNKINNNIKNTKKEKEEAQKEVFLTFWKAYPKQRAGSKEKAFKAFCRAINEKRVTEEKLLEAVQNYAKSDEVKRGFAKGCAAWLNDDRFNNMYKQEGLKEFW